MGPNDQLLKIFAAKLNVCDEVQFVGKQEQMEEILAIADLFLLPSEYESFGLAALEAMAAGVPVVPYQCRRIKRDNHPGSNRLYE